MEVKRIRKKHKVNLPESVREIVSYDHRLHGESVEWSIDTECRVAVLSKWHQRRLDEDPKAHTIQDKSFAPLERVNVNSGSNIVLINDIRAKVDWGTDIADQVVYLAHKDMLEGQKKSVYVVGGEVVRQIVRKGFSEMPEYEEIIRKSPE